MMPQRRSKKEMQTTRMRHRANGRNETEGANPTRESPPLIALVGMLAGITQPRNEAPNTTGLACSQLSSNVGGASSCSPGPAAQRTAVRVRAPEEMTAFRGPDRLLLCFTCALARTRSCGAAAAVAMAIAEQISLASERRQNLLNVLLIG